MNSGNTKAVYLFHGSCAEPPHMEIGVSFEAAGETGKARALAEGTPMIDLAGIGAYWKKPRWVTANGEWHPGERYPQVGFSVTNLSRPAENVIAFYNYQASIYEQSNHFSARPQNSGYELWGLAGKRIWQWPYSAGQCRSAHRPEVGDERRSGGVSFAVRDRPAIA
jgi:hypothetical protein